MFHLVYRSLMTSPMKDEDIKALIEKSQVNNERAQITGLLIVKGTTFFQVLEGEQGSVLRLFGKIRKDPRHQRVEILYSLQSENRIFQSWSAGVSNQILHEPDSLEPFFELTARHGKIDRSLILKTMQYVIKEF